MTTLRLRCDQCQLAIINGIPCHETGCPNSWIDPRTGKGYRTVCFYCDADFIPEEKPYRHMLCIHCKEDNYEGGY